MDQIPPNGGGGKRAWREALNTEQTIADADQTTADVDQTAADLDQISADTDQDRSDRDRHLAAADQRASDRDQKTADREEGLQSRRAVDGDAEREDTRAQRAQTTAERVKIATMRSETAQLRFRVAEQRDEAARSRDLASEARDVSANARDGLAALYDDIPGKAARKQAAEDRKHAAEDREHAAGDRWETRLDRDELRNALAEAHVDDVTGTLRRSMGNVALRSEIDRAQRAERQLSFAFVEVDSMTPDGAVSDDSTPDAVLIDVVATIRDHLRSYDPVVRFGGRTFVCAVADADVAEARVRFDRIRAAIVDEGVAADLAIGFVALEAGDSLDSVIVRGDAALYASKQDR